MASYNCYSKDDFANLVQRDPKDILNLMLEIAESSRQHPDTAYLVPFSSIPTEPPIVEMKDFGWLYAGDASCRTRYLPSFDVVTDRIERLMPFQDCLTWNGYVAAGSFAALACQPLDEIDVNRMLNKPGDVNFYPYCSRLDRGEMSVEEAAMLGYKQFLEDITEGIDRQYDDQMIWGAITKRNANCTTVVIEVSHQQPNYDDEITQYQMIHRAHTSATSVIVGFDQMACKAFYDGTMAYFTLDAALCLYFGINPVDWRRESPSHMRRVHKYHTYDYKPIFPGLSLDLVKQLSATPHIGYYLPGCLLVHRYNGSHQSPKSKELLSEIYISFESHDVDCYFRFLLNPNSVGVYDRDRAEFVRDNYLNLEQMPTIPFSAEAKESDYSSETTAYMAQCYHALSMTIREKYNLFSLYNDEAPHLIIDHGRGVNVRDTLMKTIVGSSSEFYFGTSRVRELQREMSSLVVMNHSRSIGVKMLSKQNLARLAQMQEELQAIFEARVKELEALVNPQVAKLQQGVKFITSNPGGQFTASFKPITRSRPEDYWGRHYVKTDSSRLRQLKMTLLCIRKFGSPILKQLDKHIMRLIFDQLDMAYFRHAASILPSFQTPINVVQHEVPRALPSGPLSIEEIFK